jgi:hypothetical protein
MANLKTPLREPAKRQVKSCLSKAQTIQTAATSRVTFEEDNTQEWFTPKKFADQSIKKAKLF